MSLHMFRKELAQFKKWALRDKIEADRLGFPFTAIDAAIDQDTFEAGHAALDACDAWSAKPEAKDLSMAIGRAIPADALREARLILSVTLPYFDLHPGGMVEAVPHDARRTPHARIESLERAALFFDVQVTAFRRPVKAVDLYNGSDALRFGIAGLEPVGQRSEYRITVMDGKLHHPPIWPPEAAELKSEQEESLDLKENGISM